MKKYIYIVLSITMLLAASCEDYVELETPQGSVGVSETFNNSKSAEAAVLGLYTRARYIDLVLLPGMTSDQIVFTQPFQYLLDYQYNDIPVDSNPNANLWLNGYGAIRIANIAINGLENSTNVPQDIKDQLIGEVKFWRAYNYLPLVMFFNRVPLALSPESYDNATLPLSQPDLIFDQIISDLLDAKSLLNEAYPTSERVRVNKFAVSALLARVYLYMGEWELAEQEASYVIASNMYSLTQDLSTVFQKTSNETILQLFHVNGISGLGFNFVPSSPTSLPNYGLRTGFAEGFEPADARLLAWTKLVAGSSDSYYINKYKIRSGSGGNEYYIILRLAEMYLIRAEAYAELGQFDLAEDDLNEVRERASLTDVQDLSETNLFLAIEQERHHELFGEGGYRWFDLIRRPSLTNPGLTRADDILSLLKPNTWDATDVLFPIPGSIILMNPNVGPEDQNAGY